MDLTEKQQAQLAKIDGAAEDVRRALSKLREAMTDADELPVSYRQTVRVARSQMRDLLDQINDTPVR